MKPPASFGAGGFDDSCPGLVVDADDPVRLA